MARVGTTRFAERLGVSRKAVHKAMAAQRITSWGKDAEGKLWIDEDAAAAEWARNTDPVEAAKNGKFWSLPAVATAAPDHGSRIPPASEKDPETDPEPVATYAGTTVASQAVPGGSAAPGARYVAPGAPAIAPAYSAPLAPAKETLAWPGGVGTSEREAVAASPAASIAPPPVQEPAEETNYQIARTRREKANAELAELERDKQLGLLVSKADTERAAFAVARVVRDALMSLPDRIAPRLAAETDAARIHADLEHEIRFALTGLAERLPALVAGGPPNAERLFATEGAD